MGQEFSYTHIMYEAIEDPDFYRNVGFELEQEAHFAQLTYDLVF